jgi:2-iminobutanoate/2-iminopropanoate deaminase
MNEISTPDAPRPAGHYAQAIVHNGLVYVSGQLAVDPTTGEKRLGSIEEQAEQALKNVAAILHAAGSDLSHVLKTTVYVSDISLWGRVNAVYARFFGDHRPARAVVPTRELHYGFQVEIEAIAALPGSQDRFQ